MMKEILPEKHTQEYKCNYEFAAHADFATNLSELVNNIKDKTEVIRIVFFGKTTDENYAEELLMMNTELKKVFGPEYPLVTYVTQPVLGEAEMSAEIHYRPASVPQDAIEYKEHENVRYILFGSTDGKTLMTEGIRGETPCTGVATQSDDIFRKLDAVLKQEGFAVNDIVRQWNYINRITGFEGSVQNYQAFNDSRSVFYSQADWSTCGYPAATGIGMDCGGVIVEVIAIRNEREQVSAIDNPLQVAAHNYSQNVLLGDRDKRLDNRSTPKFERAKTVWSDKGYTCYVSGTAAIRGELSLEDTDARRQTQMTLENIEHLISVDNHRLFGAEIRHQAPLGAMRVYVKNREDYESIHQHVKSYGEKIPAVYTQADVCRDELLVEIEGIASSSY